MGIKIVKPTIRNYVGQAKAKARYQELRLSTELMKEGESLDSFINRVYYSTVRRIISATAISDDCIYRIDDILRAQYPQLEELRNGMMTYYDKFCSRVYTITTASEDFIADYKLSFGKKSKRKLTSILNRTRKNVDKLGFCKENSEIIAYLCIYLRFCETIKDVWEASIKPLGIVKKHLPDYIPRSFAFLDLSEEKAYKMVNTLDPEKHEEQETDEKLSEMYNNLITLLFDNDIVNKALEYSIKENGPK